MTTPAIYKAKEINQDPSIYGTFAEIGAGQEVARHFFLAGLASNTIAKTMSAYDMTFSDEIYGKEPSGRYVCENRLNRMLEKEFNLLIVRLKEKRGLDSRFFVFANTVATKSSKVRISHGWLGVMFQMTPGSIPNKVILHTHLHESHRLWQQEALGILGVNLLHACYFHFHSYEAFLGGITEGLKRSQLSIDLIKVEGPVFKEFDEIELNFNLVQKGWCDAILIQPNNSVSLVSEQIFSKSILVQRGHFNPLTKTHVDIAQRAVNFSKTELHLEKDPIILFELTLSLLKEDNHHIDFNLLKHRLKMIHLIGYPTLITQYKEFYKTKELFRQSTQESIIFVIPANHLEKLFTPSYYENLSGGMLEGLGKLLDKKTRFYVYPHKTTSQCVTTKTFFLKHPERLIYQYFLDLNLVQDLSGCDELDHYIRSSEVRNQIKLKQSNWEHLVPEKVKEYIKQYRLYSE